MSEWLLNKEELSQAMVDAYLGGKIKFGINEAIAKAQLKKQNQLC